MKKHITNLFESINGKATNLFIQAQTKVVTKLRETRGDFAMNHAVVFVIIVVLAGIAIALLTAYLNDEFATMLKNKVSSLFN